MDINRVIAENLAALCKEQKLSLRQLSRLSGVSISSLSLIAKGEGNPTINVLLKITAALKVPYTSLIDEIKRDVTVVRKADRINLAGENPAYQTYNYFPYAANRNFEFFYVELTAHSANESPAHSDKAQEYLFVIEGTLCLTVGKEEMVLDQHDGVWFESSAVHSYENKTDAVLKFISINYYP